MELRIKELCAERGIKSAYELAKRSKLKMPTAYRAYSNDVRQFTLETLQALCDALLCEPNDIFGVASVKVKAEKAKFLKPERIIDSVDSEHLLMTKDVATQLGLSPRTVREKAERGELHGKQGKQNHWFFRQMDVDDYLIIKSGE
jgi:DNA-binding Xre family transcriptional regulator